MLVETSHFIVRCIGDVLIHRVLKLTLVNLVLRRWLLGCKGRLVSRSGPPLGKVNFDFNVGIGGPWLALLLDWLLLNG